MRWLVLLAPLTALLLGLAAMPPVARSAVLDRYIVVLRDDIDAETVAGEHAAAHALVGSHVYRYALKGYAIPEAIGSTSTF